MGGSLLEACPHTRLQALGGINLAVCMWQGIRGGVFYLERFQQEMLGAGGGRKKHVKAFCCIDLRVRVRVMKVSRSCWRYAGQRWEGLGLRCENRLGPRVRWSLVGRGYLWSHGGSVLRWAGWGLKNLLQSARPTHRGLAVTLSQVAWHAWGNLGPCLTFLMKVPWQLPCSPNRHRSGSCSAEAGTLMMMGRCVGTLQKGSSLGVSWLGLCSLLGVHQRFLDLSG